MDLDRLNSATKYPSIETHHVLGERGRLTGELGPFAGIGQDELVVLTEKVDGTNFRIVLLADGDFFIGIREELIYAKGDRIVPSTLNGATRVAIPIAEAAVKKQQVDAYTPFIQVLFMEVYGSKIGSGDKNYTKGTAMGARLFDLAYVDPAVLNKSREEIASWRDHGGQTFAQEPVILRAADALGTPCTPRLGTVTAGALPTSLEGMHHWLENAGASSQVMLDDSGLGRSEGIVLRTVDRSRIAKARFEDYARTLNPQPQRRPKGK